MRPWLDPARRSARAGEGDPGGCVTPPVITACQGRPGEQESYCDRVRAFPHPTRPAERTTMTSAIRFRVAAGFGMALLSLMLIMFVFGGVAFPAQIGNVGEIQMSAQTM